MIVSIKCLALSVKNTFCRRERNSYLLVDQKFVQTAQVLPQEACCLTSLKGLRSCVEYVYGRLINFVFIVIVIIPSVSKVLCKSLNMLHPYYFGFYN